MVSKELIVKIASICSIYYRTLILDYVEKQSSARWPWLTARQLGAQHIEGLLIEDEKV